MPTAKIEGFNIVQTWDNETKTTIEAKIIRKDEFGSMVQVGSSLTQIPPQSWPLLRNKINKLFREIEEAQAKGE